MVALGLSVMYHNIRKEPIPNKKLQSTKKLLDHIRVSRIVKIWISELSPYHCPIWPQQIPVNPSIDAEYITMTHPQEGKELPYNLEVFSSYKKSLNVIENQEAVVVKYRKLLYATNSRRTSEWDHLAGTGMMIQLL